MAGAGGRAAAVVFLRISISSVMVVRDCWEQAGREPGKKIVIGRQ
jgi:hypothetical protein